MWQPDLRRDSFTLYLAYCFEWEGIQKNGTACLPRWKRNAYSNENMWCMEKSVHVCIFKACVYKYTYKTPRWRGGVQGKGPERAALASRAGEHGGKLAGGSQRLVCWSTASTHGWRVLQRCNDSPMCTHAFLTRVLPEFLTGGNFIDGESRTELLLSNSSPLQRW